MALDQRPVDALDLVRKKVVRNLNSILDDHRHWSNQTRWRLSTREACMERDARLKDELELLQNILAARPAPNHETLIAEAKIDLQSGGMYSMFDRMPYRDYSWWKTVYDHFD